MLMIMTTMLSQLAKSLLSPLQASCQAFSERHLFLLVVPWPLIFYQHTLALNTDFPSETRVSLWWWGNWSWITQLEQGPNSWQGPYVYSPTNETWNSFKQLWPHLSFSSAVVSKIDRIYSSPSSGNIVLFKKKNLFIWLVDCARS